MLRKISIRQLNEWQWFAEVEPFDRDIWQLASISQLLANINRDTKKHKEAFALVDFVLKFGPRKGAAPEPVKAVSEEEQLAARRKHIEMTVMAWTSGHNAMLAEKKGRR